MFMANLGVVGTEKGRRMWSYFIKFMISNKGHHPSFVSLYSFFFGSSHTALGLFWPADRDMDEVIREDMVQAVKYGENKKGKKKV